MNIDEMEAGRELDALVAEKVMGWVQQEYADSLGYWCCHRTKEMYPDSSDEWLKKYPLEMTGWGVSGDWSDEEIPDLIFALGAKGIWNPSRSYGIAAAMQALDEFSTPFRITCDSLSVNVQLTMRKEKHTYDVFGYGNGFDELPLAISRALLKAVTE